MLHIVGFWNKSYSFLTNHVKTMFISINHVKIIFMLTNHVNTVLISIKHVKIVLMLIKHVKIILINSNSRQNCIQLIEIT